MCKSNKARPDTFYSRQIARSYDRFMCKMEERVLLPKRRALLENLEGNVLEVGIGTGVNLPLYPRKVNLLGIEPSAEMLIHAQKKLASTPPAASITLIKAGIGDEAVAQAMPTEGWDAIVCTLVLCTIPDPLAAIQLFKDWLKPGGQLIVLEHILNTQQPNKFFYHLLNPFWKLFSEGCNINRPTDQLLKDAGFRPIVEEYFSTRIPFYLARMSG